MAGWEGIDLSWFEYKGLNDLERVLGRLALVQIARQKEFGIGSDFLREYEEKVYYDISERIGITKERAEEIRSITYVEFCSKLR